MDLYVEFLVFLSLALEGKSEGRLETGTSSPLAEFYTVQGLKRKANMQRRSTVIAFLLSRRTV